MARSIETICSLIVADKESRTELDGLSSASETAIWRLWARVIAAALYVVEVMHDLFRSEITGLLQALKPGTLLWYQEMCKAYQHGDALAWISGAYGYAIILEENKIIAQCSVNEGQRGLVIKIAKEVSGELEPLSGPEEAAFTAYVSRLKYAGTKVSIVNSAANLLKVQAVIYYDPLIIAADGTEIASGDRTVDLAITNYLRNLPFNGRLKLSALVDAIQSIAGVEDISLTLVQHKYGSAAYATIAVSKIPESGYFKVDPAFPLNVNVSFVPNV